MESESDEERLPQFIDHLPDMSELKSVEDVERFIESLDSETVYPVSRNNHGLDCFSVEESCAKIKQLCQNTAETFEKLKRQNDELKKTASSCKKVMLKSLETRREATEAIKHLNEKTQHVLDDDVDDALLESVQRSLNSSADNSTTIAAAISKSGIELQKSGSELTVIYNNACSPGEEYFVVLSTANNEHDNSPLSNGHKTIQHHFVRSSHPIPQIQLWINNLNSTSDWPKFYLQLRDFFTSLSK